MGVRQAGGEKVKRGSGDVVESEAGKWRVGRQVEGGEWVGLHVSWAGDV